MANFYERIDENKRNSLILIFFVFLLVLLVVYVFSFLFFGDGIISIFVGLACSLLYIAFTYFLADSMVLALGGAREAKKGEFPYLVNTVEGVAIAAGLPTPKIYVVDDPALNAFAVGTSPEKASVAFTTGLLSSLNRAELEWVIAHELSHIKNQDSRMATLLVVMVGLIGILSDFGLRSFFYRGSGDRDRGGGGLMIIISLVVMILAPIVVQVVRLALSREREYLADATGAQLTRYPEGLASALNKIKAKGSVVQHTPESIASLYIANPMSFTGFFATHPPIDERIKRLREM